MARLLLATWVVALAVGSLAWRGAAAADLRIEVAGIRSTRGAVLIGLYDSASSFDNAIAFSDRDGFLNDPRRVAGAALRANTARTSGIVFTNLPPGRYAIILFQDENGNGKLDKNFWGVPTEPYGFSNDARAFVSPPTFAAASFALGAGNLTVVIDLHGGDSGVSGGSAPPAARK